MVKSIVTIYLLLATVGTVISQKVIDTTYFRSPISYRMVLAGSFGELRTNHFHAGLDIKPSSKKVDTIYASADGYVSRLRTHRAGYGQAIYIDHPNGYSTVYGHLKVFLGNIGAEVREMQRAAESYEVDFYPSPGKIMVKKGQPIGLMGNTGRSYGPHLHYEIRETDTEIPVNPFSFGIKPTDSRAPHIYSLTIHGLTSTYDKVWQKKIETKSVSKSKYQDVHVTVPAQFAGVAIHSFDKMDRAENYNGIYRMKMYVDGELAYAYQIDKIGFDETRLINAHIDYRTKQKANRTDILCYKLPSNKLNFLSGDRSGIIPLSNDKPTKVVIQVEDFDNNMRQVTLHLTKGNEELQVDQTYHVMVPADRQFDTQMYGYKMRFKEGSTVRDFPLSVSQEQGQLIFGDEADPLLKAVDVKTQIPSSFPSEKLLFVTKDKKGRWVDYGGTITNGIYTGRLGKFGAYEWYVDDVAPTIRVGSFKLKMSSSQRSATFLVDDNVIAKGQATEWEYDVWIDGKWQPARYKDMTKVLSVDLRGLESGQHTIRILAVDGRGNETSYAREFVIQ